MEEEHAVNFFWTIAEDPNLQYDDERIAERLTNIQSDENVNKVHSFDIFYRLSTRLRGLPPLL